MIPQYALGICHLWLQSASHERSLSPLSVINDKNREFFLTIILTAMLLALAGYAQYRIPEYTRAEARFC